MSQHVKKTYKPQQNKGGCKDIYKDDNEDKKNDNEDIKENEKKKNLSFMKGNSKFMGVDLGARPRGLDTFMQQKGEGVIMEAWIGRSPVSPKVFMILNKKSNNAFQKVIKEKNYENLFHYFLVLKLSDDTFYLIEKNQQVKLASVGGGIEHLRKLLEDKNYELKIVPFVRDMKLSQRPTFNQVISIAETKDACFYYYTAWDMNCQHFVFDFLHATAPHGTDQKQLKELDEFIIQDGFISLFKEYNLKGLAVTATDLAAAFTRVGGCVKEVWRSFRKKDSKEDFAKPIVKVSQCGKYPLNINYESIKINQKYLSYEPYAPIKTAEAHQPKKSVQDLAVMGCYNQYKYDDGANFAANKASGGHGPTDHHHGRHIHHHEEFDEFRNYQTPSQYIYGGYHYGNPDNYPYTFGVIYGALIGTCLLFICCFICLIIGNLCGYGLKSFRLQQKKWQSRCKQCVEIDCIDEV